MNPKKKKRVKLWLVAVAAATVLIFPHEVYEALKEFKKALEKEKEELSKRE